MNPLIKKLAEKSGFFPVPDETEVDLEYRAENARYERFAELIILEVLSQADEMMRLAETYLDKGIDIELDITKEIKNNFGIE